MYGRSGTLLYSLAAVSLVSITSRHSSHCSYSTINLHRSKVISRLVPASPHQQLSVREHGTRVTVRDLFGNMPVRVKHRAVSFQGHEENNKEWVNLRKSVVALLLACGRPITVIAQDSDGNNKFAIRGTPAGDLVSDKSAAAGRSHSFRVSSIRSILSQAAYISPSDWGSWIVTSARTISMTVRAVFSLQPAPSKRVQFISVGIRPIRFGGAGNELYDSINRIFAASSFGILDGKAETNTVEMEQRPKDRRIRSSGLTNKQLKGGRKGVDRWPMFYVQVDMHESEQMSSTTTDTDDFISNEQSLKTMINVLSEMVTHFLKEHHFRVGRKRLDKTAETNPRGPASSTSSGPTRLPLEASVTTHIRHGMAKTVTSPQRGFKLPSRSANSCAPTAEHAQPYIRSSEGQYSSKGDHVRIPSFSNPRRNHNDYMFNNWSRIKAGKRDITENVCAGLPTTKTCKGPIRSPPGADIERELKETEVGKLRVIAAVRASSCSAIGPNESVSPETLHVPPSILPMGVFQESWPQGSTEALLKENELEDSGIALDDVSLWTNPVSKATLAINSRTGMVVPRRTHRPLSPASATGSSRGAGAFSSPRRRSSSLLTHTQKDPRKPPSADSWVGRFLKSWENPVFPQTEEAIPNVQMCEITGEAAQPSHDLEHHCLQSGVNSMFEATTKFSGKLSKGALKNAKIIAQVDGKFVLIKMEVEFTPYVLENSPHIDSRLLVLVDQHAADERCRIEELMAELCRLPAPENKLFSNVGYTSRIMTTPLSKQIVFPVSVQERDMFRLHAEHFADWGILCNVVDCLKDSMKKEPKSEHKVFIQSLPPTIVERCKTEPAHLISLLRGEVWEREGKGRCAGSAALRQSSHVNELMESSSPPEAGGSEPEEHGWLQRIGDCPQGILNMLNSRACRSAIMFNDQLSREQCQTLISKLAQCAFPFQCAHGRPSMIPLVDLGGFSQEQLSVTALGAFGAQFRGGEAEQPKFVEAFRKWKEK